MAYLATQRRPGTSAPGDGSRTMTITDAAPREDDGAPSGSASEPAPVGALHLRGGTGGRGSGLHGMRMWWITRAAEEICCIYHKPKAFDESSDEDSSSSDSDSSDSSYDERMRARRAHAPAIAQRDPQVSTVTELEDVRSEPNAYEMVPSGKGKGKRRSSSGSLHRR
ncbi:hypothetical protein B0H13DRAFT_2092437 [Mycena leptocephala]|nr:hypothetical protein B0H13DRAFT_2092437 [Mycena leptocephala]